MHSGINQGGRGGSGAKLGKAGETVLLVTDTCGSVLSLCSGSHLPHQRRPRLQLQEAKLLALSSKCSRVLHHQARLLACGSAGATNLATLQMGRVQQRQPHPAPQGTSPCLRSKEGGKVYKFVEVGWVTRQVEW